MAKININYRKATHHIVLKYDVPPSNNTAVQPRVLLNSGSFQYCATFNTYSVLDDNI